MPGFNDTDQYDNATLDNWLMSMGGALAQRVCGASVEYDSTEATVNVTNTMGGLSPVGTRLDTGLIELVYAPARFDSTPDVFVHTTAIEDQAVVYYSDTSGCKVATYKYAGGVWALSDEPFHVTVLGR